MRTINLARLLPVALALLAAGCASKSSVSGTVSLNGKKVQSGTVSIIASDNIQYTGAIAEDGAYAIANVPGGPAKFCVVSPNPSPAREGLAKARPGFDDLGGGGQPTTKSEKSAWFAIPERYGDPATTDLAGVIAGKDFKHDLQLK